MSDDERAKLIKLLKETEAEYLNAVQNVTEAQWNFKPGPYKWSVGETAQHIVLAEQAMFMRIQQALAKQPNPDWEKTLPKTPVVERLLPNRAGRRECS